MAKAVHKLTPDRVKHKSKRLGLHGDGGGLYLSVKPPSAASWVFRYMLEEETTAFAGSVAEAALGHVVGDKVEAAYRRGDLFEKRRKLMAVWATFCMTPAEGAKVIPIGGRARA
jgi:hypothetical protein